VWVNGVLSYSERAVTGERAGQFVARGPASKLDARGAF
jgi:N-acyl-D-amino-acid deacylase